MMRPRVRFGFLFVMFLSIMASGAWFFPASAEEQQSEIHQLEEIGRASYRERV